MNSMRFVALAGAALLVASTAARAETKVELTGTHICCGACVRDANTILKGVEGVMGKVDQKSKSITITAKDDATAQKAVDALAAGGFHGKIDSKTVAIKDDSGAKKEKVKSLTVTGVHNCCGACTSALKKTLKGVDGVTGDTVKSKATTFEVTGDFEAAAVIKALNDAGFHAKVK